MTYERGSIDTADAFFAWLGRIYGPTVRRAAIVSWEAGDMLPVATAIAVPDVAIPTPLPTELFDARAEARLRGYTGDECDNCHALKMQQTGHCMTCAECGTTTGCA